MTAKFWEREGLRHITPAGKDNPEGWDVRSFLRELARGSVIEIGCGYGRLCTAFDPEDYIGTDINPAAVAKAMEIHPEHRFEMFNGQSADTALLYTVALHISDDDLPGFIAGINADRVIVAEIMGREWRRPGNPPVFNRDPEGYIEAFAGFECKEIHAKPYEHYKGTDITFLAFER
mgnify:CR=1 FL=1